MTKLVPDPESYTRALFWSATRHRDTGVFKTLLRLYCVAGFMQGSLLRCRRTTIYSTPSSNPPPEVSQTPKMVPELVLVAEISRFSLREHSWCETTFCRRFHSGERLRKAISHERLRVLTLLLMLPLSGIIAFCLEHCMHSPCHCVEF